MTPSIDTQMAFAFKRKGIPLWVPPSEVDSYLRYDNWSEQICIELREWFARVWSMAFAAGYRNVVQPQISKADVCRQLGKMGYAPRNAGTLADMLVGNLPGLYKKGTQIARVNQ